MLLGLTLYTLQLQKQAAEQNKHLRILYSLASELLLSSDALTSMARRYVVSQEPRFKQYYKEILAIRNGDLSRPENYNATYWKLEGVDLHRQKLLGEKISLQTLMMKNGLSENELSLLTASQNLSDKLVALEKQAFVAVENQQSTLALSIMFSDDYEQRKALIMRPLQELMDAIYYRGEQELQILEQRSTLFNKLIIFLAVVVIVLILFAILYSRKNIVIPFLAFFEQTAKIAQGNYQVRCDTAVDNELGSLAGKVNAMAEAISRDLTRKEQDKQSILEYAHYDQLTKLPNRRTFQVHLKQAFKETDRSNLPTALMFIDIDKFKEVNDVHGHHKGDLLLVEAAKRIKTVLRNSDVLARMGGDEFIVILPQLKDFDGLTQVAQGILDVLRKSFVIDGEQVFITASIGISVYPDDTDDSETLLGYADQAMYQAKEHGRNKFSYFTRSLQESMQRRIHLINELRFALGNNEFELHYQPIISLKDGSICKAEALIRWNHPNNEFVGPDEFIALAEQTGLINDIGDWVFQQATQQIKQWNDDYNLAIEVSINKSPVQFRNYDTNKQWLAELENIELAGEHVVVEITETALMDNGDEIQRQLKEARESGMKIALDDFGTGYSSLSYLTKFDIDYLKIDRSFVQEMTKGSSDFVLCEAIIVMAHKLGLEVIAEGIELEEQGKLLTAMGCEYGQGYFFSKPVNSLEFESLLKARKHYIFH